MGLWPARYSVAPARRIAGERTGARRSAGAGRRNGRIGRGRDDWMNGPRTRTSPAETPTATLARSARARFAVPALLATVAVGVAGCYNPANPDQVQPFVITLLAVIFGSIAILFVVILLIVRYFLKKLGASTTPMANGVPAEAIIETIADTGFTASAPGNRRLLTALPARAAGAPGRPVHLALSGRDYDLRAADLHPADRAEGEDRGSRRSGEPEQRAARSGPPRPAPDLGRPLTAGSDKAGACCRARKLRLSGQWAPRQPRGVVGARLVGSGYFLM